MMTTMQMMQVLFQAIPYLLCFAAGAVAYHYGRKGNG